MPKAPLFITRYSLSLKNAIGVQTNLLLHPHPDWLHFFWSNPELGTGDPRSIRLENPVFGRVSFFQQRNPVVRNLQQLGLGWWKEDHLRPELSKKLLHSYQNKISAIYAAPLEARDAKRIKQLVQIFKLPFVLHLWDFLDQRIRDNEDLCWLIHRAARIFCLSQPMLNEIAPLRRDSEYLLFSRKPSRSFAVPPQGRSMRIVLLGNIHSYRQGLDLLDQAVERLVAKGIKMSVCYLGPQRKAFRSLDSPLVRRLEPLGFVKGDDNRDKVLSDFHVGFLPGPCTDPDVDMRSRYSIPSRILDFLATGVPIVGTIRPDSATGIFCKSQGVDSHCFCQTSDDVAHALLQLLDQSEWSHLAAKNREAFTRLTENSQPEKLKRAMLCAV